MIDPNPTRTRRMLAAGLVLGVLCALSAAALVAVMLRRAQTSATAFQAAGGHATVASRLLDTLHINYEKFFGAKGFGAQGRPPLLPEIVAVDLSYPLRSSPPPPLDEIPDLSHLAFLYLQNHPDVSDAFLVRCRRLHRLRDLRLSGTSVTSIGLEAITPCNELARLELDATATADAAVDLLGKLPRLAILSLKNTPVTDVGVTAFATRRKPASPFFPLTFLWLNHTQVTDTSLAALGGLGLHQLDLTGCAITDAGIASMSPKQFDTLNTLILGATGVTDACLPHLASLPSLKRVHAEGSAITPDAANPLRDKSLFIFTSPINR